MTKEALIPLRKADGRRDPRGGFTYTEVLITLAIMAALFVPMMQLFSQAFISSSASSTAITALNLAKWQMERIKNLNYTTSQLQEKGDAYFPPLDEPPLELNDRQWRIFTDVAADSDPLEVKVVVFWDGRLNERPLVELVTLLEDMTWVRETEER